MTGNVIDFPTAGDYPLAEWGELKRLKGESLVWSQLVKDVRTTSAENGVTFEKMDSNTLRLNGSASAETKHTVVFGSAYATINNHVYMLTNVGTEKNVSLFIDGFQSSTEGYDYSVFKYSSDVVKNIVCHVGSGVSTSGTVAPLLVDLTTLFGVTEVSAVTDSMKTFVRQYAEAHPSYDAGTLIDSVYESGVSTSRNLWVNEEPMWINTNGTLTVDSSLPARGVKLPCKTGDTFTLSGFDGVYGVFAFCDTSSSFITGSRKVATSGNVLASVPAPANSAYIIASVYDATGKQIQLEKGTVSTPYTPHFTSTLSLSFLNSVPDIGIEGTLIDFERETVEWNRSVSPVFNGTENWSIISQNDTHIRFGLSVSMPNYASVEGTIDVPNTLGFKYATSSASSWAINCIDLRGTAMNVIIAKSMLASASVDGFKAYLSSHNLQFCYTLANPVTRSFSSLGITIPSDWDGGKPWVKVEAGGSFHLISGTPAEATVSFLTDLGGN